MRLTVCHGARLRMGAVARRVAVRVRSLDHGLWTLRSSVNPTIPQPHKPQSQRMVKAQAKRGMREWSTISNTVRITIKNEYVYETWVVIFCYGTSRVTVSHSCSRGLPCLPSRAFGHRDTTATPPAERTNVITQHHKIGDLIKASRHVHQCPSISIITSSSEPSVRVARPSSTCTRPMGVVVQLTWPWPCRASRWP